MKKIIIAAMLVLGAAIGYNASALTGDVNGDGSVTAADVTALYDYLLNNDQTFLATSDVDGDGVITAGDVTAIYNIILNGEEPDPGIDDYNVNIVYDGENATVIVAKNIRSLMKTLKLTAQQAMDALQIPPQEQEKYAKLL